MPKQENLKGEMPASPDQLADLFTRSQQWLENNGRLVIESDTGTDKPADIRGTHDGLPITDGMPHVIVEISGDAVRKQLPEAAETLQLGDQMNVIHWQPHYASIVGSQNYQLQPAQVSFGISKRDGLADSSQRLGIKKNQQTGDWESDRMSDEAELPAGSGQFEPEEIVKGAVYDWAKAGQFGATEQIDDPRDPPVMTQKEFVALQAIVNNLDELSRYS